MRVTILTPELRVRAIGIDDWGLLSPLVFRVQCKEYPTPFLVTVPGDYVTDFESVPKLLLFAYALIKGRFKRAATGHDYLIDLIQGEVEKRLQGSPLPFLPTRAWIDRFFYAAMIAEGHQPERKKQPVRDWLARTLAYVGVSAYTIFTGE